MMNRIVPTILAWVSVIITLALAPTIETYNTAVTTNVAAATNAAKMIGMTAIDDYGGFLTIMLLLVGTGLFAFSAMKMRSVTIADIIMVIGTVIVTVIVFALFSGTVIGYFDALITAATGVAQTFYGMLVTITYVLIVGGGGIVSGAKAYRKWKGNKPKKVSYI